MCRATGANTPPPINLLAKELLPPNPPQAGGTGIEGSSDDPRPVRPSTRRKTTISEWEREDAAWLARHPVLPASEAQRAAWARAGAQLRESLDSSSFDIWLSPLKLRGIRDGEFVIAAPSVIAGWVEDSYLHLLVEALGAPVQIDAVTAAGERGAA